MILQGEKCFVGTGGDLTVDAKTYKELLKYKLKCGRFLYCKVFEYRNEYRGIVCRACTFFPEDYEQICPKKDRLGTLNHNCFVNKEVCFMLYLLCRGGRE